MTRVWVLRTGLLVVATVVVLRGLLPPTSLPWLPSGGVALALGAAGLAFAWRRRREPHPADLRRDPATGVLIAAFAVLYAILLAHNYRLTSDGIDHFVYLRSVWIDGDLDLANDYARISPRGASVDPLTPLGRTGNLHPVGPALLWAPLYLVADGVARLVGTPPGGDGPLHRNAAALASLIYGVLGLCLTYRAAARDASRWAALAAALAIGFGTFLYWYLAFAPTMAHAVAFFAAALFVYVWRCHPQGSRRAAWLGLGLGLVALTRWANVLIGLVLLGECWTLLRKDVRAGLRQVALVGAVAAAAFLPQMLVWKLLYGAWLTVPQGATFLAGGAAWGGVLFSPHHGLFAWSPLLYLALPGLIVLTRREPLTGLGVAAFALALTRLNAGVADWWGGAAFGARRFDALLPLLALGLALTFDWIARWAARRPKALPLGLAGVFVVANVLIASRYEQGAWDYAGPVAFEQQGHAVISEIDRTIGSPFSLPGSLYERWRTGTPLRDYEARFTERRYGRWSIRMGLDDRLFIEDGWSAAREEDGVRLRTTEGDAAGLVVPLHSPRNVRLGLRLKALGTEPTRWRVLVNGRVAGSVEAGSAWGDIEVDVPADALRPGRNDLRLRRIEGGPIAVAGAWAEPAN